MKSPFRSTALLIVLAVCLWLAYHLLFEARRVPWTGMVMDAHGNLIHRFDDEGCIVVIEHDTHNFAGFHSVWRKGKIYTVEIVTSDSKTKMISCGPENYILVSDKGIEVKQRPADLRNGLGTPFDIRKFMD